MKHKDIIKLEAVFAELFPEGIDAAIEKDPELKESAQQGEQAANEIIKSFVDSEFNFIQNDDLKRYEFESKTNEYTSFRVSFGEVSDKKDAYRAVWLAITKQS